MVDQNPQIQYWRSIQKEINETLGNLTGLTLVLHNSAQFSDVVSFLNKVQKNSRSKVLYFSFTTSYDHIKTTLEQCTLNGKEIHVVDMVSGFLLEIQDNIDCVFRKPPQTIEEMKMVMFKNINRVKPDIVFVDSLLQFFNLSNPSEQDVQKMYQFFGSLKEAFMASEIKTIILMYDEKHGRMEKLPLIFTDLILKMDMKSPDDEGARSFLKHQSIGHF